MAFAPMAGSDGVSQVEVKYWVVPKIRVQATGIQPPAAFLDW